MRIIPCGKLAAESLPESFKRESLLVDIQRLTRQTQLILQKARQQKEKIELTSQLQAATHALSIASFYAE